MATFADVDRILAQYNGKYAGVQYGGIFQCVAWAAVFSGEMGNTGYLPTPKTNGARDIYEVFANPLPTQYDRIANTPSFVPRKGDMVIWTGMPNNPYGHVAIANGVGDTNTFQSYDQNWTGGEKVHAVSHNYNYVLGVLRPKNLTNAQGVPTMKATKQDIDSMFRRYLGRKGGDEWVGADYDAADNGIRTSPEAIAYRTAVLSVPTPAEYNSQVHSQQEQITRLTSELTASQANDTADAKRIDDLEKQILNVPNQPHQDSAQAAAEELKPAVSWIKRVIEWLGK